MWSALYPLNLLPRYQKKYSYCRGDFPNAESSFQCVVSLSIHPVLKDEDIDLVIEVARSILAG